MKIRQPFTAAYAKKRIAVGANWVAVNPPFDCNYFGIRNLSDSSPVFLRTEGEDLDCDSLGPMSQDGVTAPYVGDGSRFKRGSAVFELRADVDVEVIVTWVK